MARTPADTTRCGQCAGATHPTGMHSCFRDAVPIRLVYTMF